MSLKVIINSCPNCKGQLFTNSKLAQGCWECEECKTRFFILITSSK